MLIIKRLTVLYLLISALQGLGQISQYTNLDSDYFQMKVKSLDDFIGRFNYQQDPEGQPLKYADSLKNKRILLISSLFDRSLLKDNKDSTVRKTVSEFLNTVAGGTKPVLFDYFSPLWYAEATCPALLNGKKARVTFMLRTVRNNKGDTRWEIYDARGSFIDFGDNNPEVFVGPAAHNLNFLDVSKTTQANPRNFINLLPHDFKPDCVSVITFLISSKALKLEPFNKVKFHVSQVPGFDFLIENLNREGPNSGWLITGVKRTGK